MKDYKYALTIEIGYYIILTQNRMIFSTSWRNTQEAEEAPLLRA